MRRCVVAVVGVVGAIGLVLGCGAGTRPADSPTPRETVAPTPTPSTAPKAPGDECQTKAECMGEYEPADPVELDDPTADPDARVRSGELVSGEAVPVTGTVKVETCTEGGEPTCTGTVKNTTAHYADMVVELGIFDAQGRPRGILSAIGPNRVPAGQTVAFTADELEGTKGSLPAVVTFKPSYAEAQTLIER